MRVAPLLLVLPFILLIVALNVYVYRRLSPIATTERRRRALLACFVIGPLCLAASRLLPQFGHVATQLAVVCGFVGHGLGLVVIFCASFALVRDAVRALGFLARRLKRPAPAPAPTEETLSRRAFVERTAAYTALAASTGTTVYGLSRGRVDRVIDEVSFRLPKLPRTRDGYVIAQLSDVHFGQYVGERELREAVEMVSRIRPDLVVMTGDLVDHDPSYVRLLGKLVRTLESRARDGVVIIPGNHDFYTGVDLVVGAVERAGGTVLRNQHVIIGAERDGFALLGVDDMWGVRDGGEGADVDKAKAGLTEDLARVLLCHQPAYFREAAPHVDLMLAGHTHGGQIGLGGHPADLVLPYGYVRGTYTYGDATLYVNRGFGTAGPPARVGSAPEVTKIVLTV